MLPNILAILIGFTISAIAIIISGGEEKKIKLQTKLTDRKIDGKFISVYQYTLIILIYVLLQEIFNLLMVFLIEFINPLLQSGYIVDIGLGVYVFYLLHILLIIVRSIIYLYTCNYKDESIHT